MGEEKETAVREEQASQPGRSNRFKMLSIGAALVAFALIYWFLPVDDTDTHTAAQVRTGLAILALAAILWLTEAIPLAITALLVPVVSVLAGVFPGEAKTIVPQAFAGFAHHLIFLFVGGFGIAAALTRQGLNRWLANSILILAGGRFHFTCIGLFCTAAFTSMWISNTATTALLFPVALGLLSDLEDKSGLERARQLAPFILLGLAYSASIGGIGTIIGTFPNAIAAEKLGIDFLSWLKFGIPCVAILLPSLIVILFLVLRPGTVPSLSPRKEPFVFTTPRILTLTIFLLTIVGWLCSKPLSEVFNVAKGFDSIIAVSSLVLMASFGLVRWKDVDRTTDWGVIILFGGGLTLGTVLKLTGASSFLASHLNHLTAGWPFLLIVGAVVVFVIFLTELTSNTATTTLFVPIFYQVAIEIGVSPTQLILPLTIAASCAFMLPIATPPNAIVYGSGQVAQRTMMRTGLVLNVSFALILTALSTVLF
jgi:sodium-dependent dicarboxylate transporter 2/3/5